MQERRTTLPTTRALQQQVLLPRVARAALWVGGWRVRQHGSAPTGQHVFVSNHTAALDVVVDLSSALDPGGATRVASSAEFLLFDNLGGASAADLATFDMPMVSKTLTMGGIGPPARSSASAQRQIISLQPPQPGTKPTAVSTRPA